MTREKRFYVFVIVYHYVQRPRVLDDSFTIVAI